MNVKIIYESIHPKYFISVYLLGENKKLYLLPFSYHTINTLFQSLFIYYLS